MQKLSRANVTYRQNRDSSLTLGDVPTYWEATYWGEIPSGETIDITLYGKTRSDAQKKLEAALAEEGWELDDDVRSGSRLRG